MAVHGDDRAVTDRQPVSESARLPAAGSAPSVLGKVQVVLAAFRPGHEVLTISELMQETGLAKATAYRLTAQLTSVGLLERAGEGYTLGLKVFELGQHAARRRIVHDVALVPMYELLDTTGSTVHLAVLLGGEVMCVEKLRGHARLPLKSRVGGRTPALASGLGRALLAYSPTRLSTTTEPSSLGGRPPGCDLRRVRESGVALKGDAGGGLVCVASAVTDEAGNAVAAISASGLVTSRLLHQVEDAVRSAAATVSETMRRQAMPSG